MKIKYIFKNVEVSSELSQYLESRLFKLVKFQIKPLKSSQFTFSIEGHLYCVEIVIQDIDKKYYAKVKEKNFFLAIDQSINKIIKQLNKRNKKIKNHKNRGNKSSKVLQLKNKEKLLSENLFQEDKKKAS